MSDLKLPLALVIAMIAQVVAGTFWVSKQAHRIEHLEKQVADSKKNSFVLANEIEEQGLGEFLPRGFKKNRFDFARTQARNITNNTNGTSN